MNKEELEQICVFCTNLVGGEALNMDDIDAITQALKEFNGEDEITQTFEITTKGKEGVSESELFVCLDDMFERYDISDKIVEVREVIK